MAREEVIFASGIIRLYSVKRCGFLGLALRLQTGSENLYDQRPLAHGYVAPFWQITPTSSVTTELPELMIDAAELSQNQS